jgi:hypothetical protein
VLGIAVQSATIIPDENYERGEVFAAALTVLVEPMKLHDNASVEKGGAHLTGGRSCTEEIRGPEYPTDGRL